MLIIVAIALEILIVFNLQRQVEESTQCSKKKIATFKRETKKTGGGPAPTQPSQASEKSLKFLKKRRGFSGLKGFEIGEPSTSGE